MEIINRLRLFFLFIPVIAGLGNLACKQKAAFPPLPKVVTSDFPEGGRAQVDNAVRDATMNPEDAGATGRLAMILQAYQQLELSELCYRRARAMDPKAFDWAYYLAVVEQLRGETAQAIDDARTATKLDAASRPARMRYADALLQGNDHNGSLQLYEKLVAEEPDRALYQYGMGKALVAGGSVVEAIPHFKRACELSPTFATARYALAMAYDKIGDTEQSSRELATYEKNPSGKAPEDPQLAPIVALNHGGVVGAQAAQDYLAQGKPAEAARELEIAVANNPKDEASHSNLVAAYWVTKQYDKAEQHYRIAAGLNPSTNAHYLFGLMMMAQSRYAEATQAFRHVLEFNPRDAGANTQLGRIMETRGDRDGAIHQYEIALETDPKYRAANYVLGVALLKQGKTQEAIEHLLKTVEPVDVKTPGYMRQLSEAYRRAGNDTSAIRYSQLIDKEENPDATSTAALAGQFDAPVRTPGSR